MSISFTGCVANPQQNVPGHSWGKDAMQASLLGSGVPFIIPLRNAALNRPGTTRSLEFLFLSMVQALLHLAMLSEHTATLKAHGVPNYISGANIVRANRRPLTAPSMLESEAFHRALLGAVPPRNISTAPPALKSSFLRSSLPWQMHGSNLRARQYLFDMSFDMLYCCWCVHAWTSAACILAFACDLMTLAPAKTLFPTRGKALYKSKQLSENSKSRFCRPSGPALPPGTSCSWLKTGNLNIASEMTACFQKGSIGLHMSVDGASC